MKSSHLEQCPCCEEVGTIYPYETIKDYDGNLASILICQNCLVTINKNAFTSLNSFKSIREAQHSDFYSVSKMSREEIQEKIDEQKSILKYLLKNLEQDPKKLTFCEIGAGSGFLSLAATQKFAQVYACEFDLRHINDVIKVIKQPDNFKLIDAEMEIKDRCDVLVLWHVLEHLPNPVSVFKSLANTTQENAILFMQVPCYRPQYVFNSHYCFYNESSMRFLLHKLDYHPIEIGFDVDNDFLTILAQRNKTNKENQVDSEMRKMINLRSVFEFNQDIPVRAMYSSKIKAFVKSVIRNIRNFMSGYFLKKL